MSEKRDYDVEYFNVMKALAEGTVDLTEEEIEAEERLLGLEPLDVGSFKARIATVLDDFDRGHTARAAGEAVAESGAAAQDDSDEDEEPSDLPDWMPKTARERRHLMINVVAYAQQSGQSMTSFHRKISKTSDRDVISSLEDLHYIGLIQKYLKTSE